MVTLVVLFGYLLYPFPPPDEIRNYLLVAMEFLNVYDVMDLLKDLACLKYISVTWRVIQYVSMGTSLLLVSFNVDTTKDHAGSVDICGRYCRARAPDRVEALENNEPRGGEENTEHNKQMETLRRIIKLIATMMCMNICFTVMRVRIMVEHKEIDNGLIMVAKNFIMFILNTIYLTRQIISFRKLRNQSVQVDVANNKRVAWT